MLSKDLAAGALIHDRGGGGGGCLHFIEHTQYFLIRLTDPVIVLLMAVGRQII